MYIMYKSSSVAKQHTTYVFLPAVLNAFKSRRRGSPGFPDPPFSGGQKRKHTSISDNNNNNMFNTTTTNNNNDNNNTDNDNKHNDNNNNNNNNIMCPPNPSLFRIGTWYLIASSFF